MPSVKRLRLDEVITSFPELGPTVPDGGYAWIILCGVFLVQMTVPSILAMYGVVLAYIYETKFVDFHIWNETIILTPILFTAFWSLADPWTRIIVSIASVPCLVGLTGVILLVVGIIASGYLATGGVGAYLTNISAGAIMGIGASFVILLSNHILRKHFRKKLVIALTIRNVGSSFGLVLIPSITYLLLHEARLKTGLQLITMMLLPTAIGTLTFRLPSVQQTSPYSLLLSTEEDTELPVRISSDAHEESQHQNDIENFEYNEADDKIHSGGLLSEGNNIYAYEDMDEDVDLFVNPTTHSNNKWEHQLRILKDFRFWAAITGWVGMKVSALFFWLLLPVLSDVIVNNSYLWMSLSIVAGFSTFLPNWISYKTLKLRNQNRRLFFGVSSLICGFSLLGLIRVNSYSGLLIFAFLGGISIGGLSSCQDLALYDVLGSQVVHSIDRGFSTIVGLFIFGFYFIYDINLCLSLAALLQFLGGLYWISSPALNLLKATRYSFRTVDRASNDEI